MLTNNTIIQEPVSNLTLQIGAVFSGLYNRLKTPTKPQLAESFDIWNLGANDLLEPTANDQFPAHKTNVQHHQIKLGSKAEAYALSQPSTSGSPEVFKAALSKVAERMDEAIAHLDNDDKDDQRKTEVRLLVVPACWVYAFWLVERQQVYLFSAPHRFKRLQEPRYLKTGEFLSLLNDELAPFQPLVEQPTMRW